MHRVVILSEPSVRPRRCGQRRVYTEGDVLAIPGSSGTHRPERGIVNNAGHHASPWNTLANPEPRSPRQQAKQPHSQQTGNASGNGIRIPFPPNNATPPPGYRTQNNIDAYKMTTLTPDKITTEVTQVAVSDQEFRNRCDGDSRGPVGIWPFGVNVPNDHQQRTVCCAGVWLASTDCRNTKTFNHRVHRETQRMGV